MFLLQLLRRGMRFASKIALIVIVFVAVISIFSTLTSKDKIKIDPDATIREQRKEIYKTINDPQYQKNDQGKLAIGVYRSVLCGTIGEACTDNPDDADKNYNKSIFGFVSNLIVLPYANPPASGMYFAYDRIQKAGFIPKTYAAEGIGFASIKPMIKIWEAFRNVAYLILVLVLIAIGFMIMFRMKLNPQTVITLENSLPKIVVSLILITFSFAIAGFLIDLMYVGMSIVISILTTVEVGKLSINNLPAVQNRFISASVFDIFPYKMDPFALGSAFVNLIPQFNRVLFNLLTTTVVGFAFRSWILAPFAIFTDATTHIPGVNVVADFAQALLKAIILFALVSFGPQLLLGILFLFTMLFFVFRLFFLLLFAYIKILILIILSPLFLIFEAIPGRNAFSFWLRTLIGELLTFPLTVLLVLVGYLLVNVSYDNQDIFKVPFLFGIDTKSFGIIVGFGMLLLIPQLVKIMKELLGIKPIPGLRPGFFSGAATAGGAMLGTLGAISSINLGAQALTGTPLRDLASRIFGQRGQQGAAGFGGQQQQQQP